MSGDNRYARAAPARPQHPYPCAGRLAFPVRDSGIMRLSLSESLSPPLHVLFPLNGRSPEGGNSYSSIISLSFI